MTKDLLFLVVISATEALSDGLAHILDECLEQFDLLLDQIASQSGRLAETVGECLDSLLMAGDNLLEK